MAQSLHAQQTRSAADLLFPVAVLYLGSRSEAAAAVTEALAAAAREDTGSALPQLLRICRTRASEQTDADLFPDDSPLSAVMRLPAGSRRDLALSFSGFSQADAADARGLTAAEFAQKLDKSLRQLTFLQSGVQPDPDQLDSAVRSIVMTPAEADAVCLGVQQAEEDYAAQQMQAKPEGDLPSVREIVRTDNAASKPKSAIPVWGIVLVCICIILLCAVIGLLLDRRNIRQQPHTGVSHDEEAEPYTVQNLTDLHYISMDDARAAALADAGLSADDVTFTNTKLDTGSLPVCYKIIFIDSNAVQYEYTLDAESGKLLKQQSFQTDTPLDTEGWLPISEMRRKALAMIRSDAVLILREQLGNDGERGYYKFTFQDAEGKMYTVQFDAADGILLKYTVETPKVISTAEIISLETAKQQAVGRVGNLSSDQVIFTKEKLDGAVYLISFTLDDGTQYALELDAATGMTNTLDVHPVAADTSRAIGLLAAKDIVLRQADLTDADILSFSKAKIDRSNGAYVYELEFETAAYDYEATLDMVSGEILRYRAWYK